jgi:transcriptional regulator GlxA family with amidase domain
MNQIQALPVTEIVVFDGFDDLDAVAPLEILAAAGFPVRTVRPPGQAAAVRSAHGLALDVPAQLGKASGLVVVPGGGWADGARSGVRSQCQGELPARLAELSGRGTVLASVCTGAMLLAAAGVVEGRPAVTNRLALDDLAAAGADVQRGARVVDDGNVITSGGPSAGLDLAIRLVARFAGPDAAARAAQRLEYEPVGPVLVGAL